MRSRLPGVSERLKAYYYHGDDPRIIRATPATHMVHASISITWLRATLILGLRVVGWPCLSSLKPIPGAARSQSLKLVVWVTACPRRSGIKAVRILLAEGSFGSRLCTIPCTVDTSSSLGRICLPGQPHLKFRGQPPDGRVPSRVTIPKV
jgi:hypothetical protein